MPIDQKRLSFGDRSDPEIIALAFVPFKIAFTDFRLPKSFANFYAKWASFLVSYVLANPYNSFIGPVSYSLKPEPGQGHDTIGSVAHFIRPIWKCSCFPIMQNLFCFTVIPLW